MKGERLRVIGFDVENLVAILSDYVVFSHLFTRQQVMMGSVVKLSLVLLFGGSYWHSTRVHGR